MAHAHLAPSRWLCPLMPPNASFFSQRSLLEAPLENRSLMVPLGIDRKIEPLILRRCDGMSKFRSRCYRTDTSACGHTRLPETADSRRTVDGTGQESFFKSE